MDNDETTGVGIQPEGAIKGGRYATEPGPDAPDATPDTEGHGHRFGSVVTDQDGIEPEGASGRYATEPGPDAPDATPDTEGHWIL